MTDDLKRLEEIEARKLRAAHAGVQGLDIHWLLATDIPWLISRLRAALTLPEDAEGVVLAAENTVELLKTLSGHLECADRLLAMLSLVRPALARVKDLTAQISHVDEILSRRPALADCPDRLTKIEKCISTARESDELKARVRSLEEENERLRVVYEWELNNGAIHAFDCRCERCEALAAQKTVTGKEDQ